MAISRKNSRLMERIGALALLLCLSSQLAAAPCSASSGSERVALLELYTSEGCSSCPPAERWLSRLDSPRSGAERVVPLALHVDYWDSIGWKDRYAQSKFSARQRDMARLGRSNAVYTPQVLLNGRDFRPWAGDSFSRAVDEINGLPAHATIALSLLPGDSDGIKLAASVRGNSGGVLYVAIYQNDLYSEVSAGENRGRRLHHDYVVREWYGPFPVGRTGSLAWQGAVKLKPGWIAAKMGVAAFVQDQATGEILQAMRLPWCGG